MCGNCAKRQNKEPVRAVVERGAAGKISNERWLKHEEMRSGETPTPAFLVNAGL